MANVENAELGRMLAEIGPSASGRVIEIPAVRSAFAGNVRIRPEQDDQGSRRLTHNRPFNLCCRYPFSATLRITLVLPPLLRADMAVHIAHLRAPRTYGSTQRGGRGQHRGIAGQFKAVLSCK